MEKQKLAIPSCLQEEEKGPEPTALWQGPLGCLGGQCDFLGEKALSVLTVHSSLHLWKW